MVEFEEFVAFPAVLFPVLLVVEFEEFVAFPAVLFPVLLFVEFTPCNLWTLLYLSSLIK